MTFKEFIGNTFNWIKKAIQSVWHVFKVLVKRVFKYLGAFMRAIGDVIGNLRSDIEAGLKKIFVVKTKKSDLTDIIIEAEKNGKVKKVQTTPDELFGTNIEKTDYDYSIVITNNNFDPVKIETISAEELDKKIGEKFSEDVSEIKY